LKKQTTISLKVNEYNNIVISYLTCAVVTSWT